MTGFHLEQQSSFSEKNPSSCRIETQGGTVYWLSGADERGVRWIVREHLKSSDTNTMIMQNLPGERDLESELGDKFRGRIHSDVEVGSPFVLEIAGKESRILSEPVVAIEVGNVPSMLFG